MTKTNKTNSTCLGPALRHLSTACCGWTSIVGVCRGCVGRRVGRLGDVGARQDWARLVWPDKKAGNRPLVLVGAQSASTHAFATIGGTCNDFASHRLTLACRLR